MKLNLTHFLFLGIALFMLAGCDPDKSGATQTAPSANSKPARTESTPMQGLPKEAQDAINNKSGAGK